MQHTQTRWMLHILIRIFVFCVRASYCDGARRFVNHATPEFLEWSWRRERIHQLILDADRQTLDVTA